MVAMEPSNRAERRKSKFGRGRAAAQGGWPTVKPNPVFEAEDVPGNAAGPDTADTEPGVVPGKARPAKDRGSSDGAAKKG